MSLPDSNPSEQPNALPPVQTDDNIPKGWVFLKQDDGTLVPIFAVMPKPEEANNE